MDSKDVVIIGGGPAGYVAAIRTAQLGGKATLIEKNTLGGTCVSRGCIPVKALVRAAELIDVGKYARDYGVNYPEMSIDFLKMLSRRDTIVRTVASGVKLLLDGNGVEVISGTAKFLSPSEIHLEALDGTSRSFAARRTIIATGSRCSLAAAPTGAPAITTDEVLTLKEVPGSLLIVGGGFVGLAFATIYSRLGSKVTVVERYQHLLPEIDTEIVSILEKELKRSKIQIHIGAWVTMPLQTDNKKITIAVGGQSIEVTADHILLAESREPNAADLGLDKAGVKINEQGGIQVNARMETSVSGILAGGDVTGQHMWTHVAYAEGIIAAENAMGRSSTMDYNVVPYCANTIPEVAGVGLTEENAIAGGYRVKVGRFPFAANASATIIGQRTGMMKIVSEEKYGQILGAHAVGPQASTLVSELALAMKLEVTPADIASLLHTHPSLSEVCWEAARDVTGETIHFISENRSVE
jgi:dihydrolipoamide dehydrogenase